MSQLIWTPLVKLLNVFIRLSEVHRKTGAELVSNGIVGRSLETKQKVTSQIQPRNTIVDEFGTSLSLNFGKANIFYILFISCFNRNEKESH